MKVVTILGSPRRKGNTATVLGWVEDELKRHGHDVERIDISRHDVKGCLGCYKCQKKLKEPGCPQKDDALGIFDKMIAAGESNATWNLGREIDGLFSAETKVVVNF